MSRVAQPARFLVVGAAGYGINVATFALLVASGVKYVPASVVSYAVSNALMYLGNRYFTFRLGHDGFWGAYVRYLLVGLVVIVMNAAVLALFVELFGLDETLAQALSLLAVTPPAYVLFKRWTFRVREHRAVARATEPGVSTPAGPRTDGRERSRRSP